MSGEYFDGEKYQTIRWTPDLEDLEYLRSFKFVDLTFRGTLELRSACMQPISEAMTVPAFHLGLAGRRKEFAQLLDGAQIYREGYTPVELRKLFVRRKWPAFADRKEIQDLLVDLVDIAKAGLKDRGYGEEVLLEPLEERAVLMQSPALQMLRGIESGRTIEDYIEEYGRL